MNRSADDVFYIHSSFCDFNSPALSYSISDKEVTLPLLERGAESDTRQSCDHLDSRSRISGSSGSVVSQPNNQNSTSSPPYPAYSLHKPTTRSSRLLGLRTYQSLDVEDHLLPSLLVRRNSQSMEVNTIKPEDTIHEVPHETYSPMKQSQFQREHDAANYADMASIRNKQSNSGSKAQRAWPAIRSKFIRMGSLRRFDSQPMAGVGNNVPPLQRPGLGSGPELRVNFCQSPTGMKHDATVQFDENILNNEDLFGRPPDDGEQKQVSTSRYLKEQFFAFFQPSDNKLAMKLFGNKNALMKEKKRQQQQGKWIIHPCSNFRFYWDLMMLVLLITNLIVLPVAISFFSDDLSLKWIVFNCASDTVFLVDIFVNFRSGVITNDFADEIILNPKEIARNYVKTWFFLDFISSIPMDYLFLVFNKGKDYTQFVHAGRTLRILRLAKLLSMLRLLRLSRLVRYVSQWEAFLNIASKFMGIFNLVLLMLLLGHWNACLQFLIPTLMEFPSDSWVTKCKLQESYWFSQYTWALFKAMSHMLSIGYGRFPPTSISEAWITIVSMMTGATCYALFVGHAAALIQSFDTSKRLYREKFKQVEEYMAYRKLPRALRQRIANYYEHRYQGKMFNEAEILSELSECLREQIINYNCRALVAAVPFFTYADQDFVSEVVTKLIYEVYQPGDLIIKEGTLGIKMYFIQEGIVDIITKDGEVATSLSDGSYFGEICLLTNAKRVASVRAETYCNLYSLDRDHFLSVLHNYPLMRRTMESVAAERLSKIGQNPCIVSNREDLTEDLNLVKEIVSSVTPMVSEEEDENSDTEKDREKDRERKSSKKDNRRKSVVKLGLQRLGITKSKSYLSVSGDTQQHKPLQHQPHHHSPFSLLHYARDKMRSCDKESTTQEDSTYEATVQGPPSYEQVTPDSQKSFNNLSQ